MPEKEFTPRNRDIYTIPEFTFTAIVSPYDKNIIIIKLSQKSFYREDYNMLLWNLKCDIFENIENGTLIGLDKDKIDFHFSELRLWKLPKMKNEDLKASLETFDIDFIIPNREREVTGEAGFAAKIVKDALGR